MVNPPTIRRVALALLLVFGSSAEAAPALRFFGSLGAEARLTPANRESPLNALGSGHIAQTTNLADATLYVDAKSERWKGHLKLRGDASDRASDRGEIGEAFVQVAVTPWLDVTAGRVIEKWGTGYAWNPTSFIGPAKNPADAGDRRSANRGVDLVRAAFAVRDTEFSLYALREHTYAMRVYRLVSGTDVALHVWRDASGTKQGLSVSRVFGDALELHGEAARRHLLVGGQYTFPSNVNVTAELYRSGDGLTESRWDGFREQVDAAVSTHNGNALREVNRQYVPLRMGRSYAFVRIVWPSHDQKADLEALTIVSLRDRSSIVQATFSYKVRPDVSLYIMEMEFPAARDSELAYVQVARVTTFGARVYF